MPAEVVREARTLMPFNTKHTTRERWAKLQLGLVYYDGRCEAERAGKDRAAALQEARCRNNAVAVNQGSAVCWRHRQRDFFKDPDALAFRGDAVGR